MVDIKSVARLMKSGTGWSERTCFICGRHFTPSDTIALVVVYGPQYEICKQYSRLKTNQVMHADELQQICNISNTVEDVYRMLANAPQPKRQQMTEEQKREVKLFEEAAIKCGFKDVTEKNNGCRCKMYGSTDIVEYNVFSGRIRYNNKRRRQLFDRLAERQIVANVYNKFHELLGDGKYDDFTMAKAIADVNQKVAETRKTFGL